MTQSAATQTTPTPAIPAGRKPGPEDTINALNGVFGRHARERSSHAKGFCAAGRFVPSEPGETDFTASLFGKSAIPVTARFSIGGGNPSASDTDRSVRGLGVRFHLDEGEKLDLVMISAPVFFAATPDQFVAFLKARTADPATGQKDVARIEAFNRANPNVMAHLNHVAGTPPPKSYATTPYYSTHAFLFENAAEQKQAARWSVEPVGGFEGLTREQEDSFPDSFLEQELNDRLAHAPAQWDVYLQMAELGDAIDDPTSVWPETRSKRLVGRLEIDRTIEEGSKCDCTGLVYDPNNLPAGISPTDDPILAIRSPAYAVSFSRRTA